MTLPEENAALRERGGLGVWADEARNTRLVQLVDLGWSASQIAAEFRLTRNAIIGRVSRMGMKLGMHAASSPLQRAQHGLYTPPTPRKTPTPQPYKPRLEAKVMTETPQTVEFAKPWEERRFGECAWLINDETPWIACCAPISRRSYCEFHASKAFLPARVHRRVEKPA